MKDRGIKLSVVATSRNDDHGDNLQRRMQTFVNAFINQCKRHDLRAELILVEWNPPTDRPPLAEALNWPSDMFPCDVRIIQVPESIHRRFQHSEALPLFQMIGKNVGIRRARGQFILATNIDIILNDELMHFLKEGNLEKGKIYRIDRTDVGTDVSQDGTVEEQLAYCRNHHVRVNSVHGTFPLRPDGIRTAVEEDVATVESGLVPMQGTSQLEKDAEGKPFRWAGGDVRVLVTAPADHPRRLLIELSPGPCVRGLPMEMEVLLDDKVVARGCILGRCVASLVLPLKPGAMKIFHIRAVEGGFYPAPAPDPRLLDFAFHRLSWSDDQPQRPPLRPEEAFKIVASELAPKGDVVTRSARIRPDLGWHDLQTRGTVHYRWSDSAASLVLERPTTPGLELRMWVGAGASFNPARKTTLQLRDELDRILGEAKLKQWPQLVRFPVPANDRAGQRVFLHVLEDGITLTSARAVQAFRLFSCSWSDAPVSEKVAAAYNAWKAVLGLKLRGQLGTDLPSGGPKTEETYRLQPYWLPYLHTNACGDFTLMAREHWFSLGAYSELEMYSLHIDSLIMYAGHYAGLKEVTLMDDMRAYHIEHSAGSGWTPEGENKLFERLRSNGIPVLTTDELYSMAHGIATHNNPLLFGTPKWGLAGETLPEMRIGKVRSILAA